MQAPDALLFAIAQISVSLAGFSGLIAALRATTGEWHPRDIWSLSWMLGSSVGALLLALLPLWLALAGDTDEHVYRVSCAASAVAIGSFAIAMSLAGRRLTRRGFPRRVPGVPSALFLLLACAAIDRLRLGAAGPTRATGLRSPTSEACSRCWWRRCWRCACSSSCWHALQGASNEAERTTGWRGVAAAVGVFAGGGARCGDPHQRVAMRHPQRPIAAAGGCGHRAVR
jgi:hypothetical protein